MKQAKLFFPRLLMVAICIHIVACEKTTDSRILEIDNVLSNLQKQELFNGNILIAEEGTVLFQKSYGYANFEASKKLDKQTIFDIGSISKTFTAVSVMILQEQGLLNIEDPISKYLPNLPYSNISIRNLLSHTSGIPEEQRSAKPILKEIAGKGFSNEQIKDILIRKNVKLDFKPGTRYAYSNTNYTLLSLIIEKISGAALPAFLEENIFIPINMKSTFFSQHGVPEIQKKNLSKRYTNEKFLHAKFINTDKKDSISDLTWSNKNGGDKIYSTTGDLFKFHNALQQERLLNRTSLEKMYAPFYLINNEDYEINTASNYPSYSGCAWRIAKDDKHGKIVHHAGGVIGGRTFMMRNLMMDQFVIVLTNNEETNRWTFTFPLKVLNNELYKLDKIKLSKEFGKTYRDSGLEIALSKYDSLKSNDNFVPINDWDFESIGVELLELNDTIAAIEIFKRYTEKYPKEAYSWFELGNTYKLAKRYAEAKNAYEMAVALDPDEDEYAQAIEVLISKHSE